MKQAFRLLSVLAVLAAAFGADASTAQASTKFHNSTSHTIWLVYAHSSVNGLTCGYITCGGEWKEEGWWKIEPNQTVIVNGHTYGNNLERFYAEDDVGHIWSGDRSMFIDRVNAFSHCGPADLGDNLAPYRTVRGSRCCGGTCPNNHTYNLVN